MSDVQLGISRPAAWIEVTGDDSFPFLQGQFSNDLRSPSPNPATYGLWLDRKGRVLADSFILQEADDRFYLYSPFSSAAAIIERLEPYIIADDVSLRDVTSTATVASLWGQRLDDVLLALGLNRPDRGAFLRDGHRFLFHGRRTRGVNLELLLGGGASEEAVTALTAAVEDCGGAILEASELEDERIRSAIPAVPRDVGPRDLPQEGGLEKDAIAYEKGCYLGQEVMARIRSMGRVRRVLAQLELSSVPEELPAPLYQSGREAGSLRSAAPGDPAIGLGLVRREACEVEGELALTPDGESAARIINVFE